ncbi:MAG TPA: methyltransferase domain-containing protein [Chthoniobacterales bacterium]|nr:methyltransferase domain-containing protein [Chthoniobacterales bacterium]
MRIQNILPLTIRRSLGNFWHQQTTTRNKRRLLKKLQGKGTICNICQWEGARFGDDAWHPGTVCPHCGSQVRHRMLTAMLDGRSSFPELQEHSLLAGKTVLHFAPERQLRHRIEKASKKYISSDYDRGDIDLKLNMSAMPTIADTSFDVVIACDVLEHVPDDRAAMRELYRILKPNGIAIITAPQKDSPSTTDEDPSITDPEQRLKNFGQRDHLRIYGDDLKERLTATGFQVTIINTASFSTTDSDRFVLVPPKRSSHPLATNNRRLYINIRPTSRI